jgi:hypothetical protein
VWGCSLDIARDYVTVTSVGTPVDHASDTALAEEVGHWVWYHYKPQVDPIEAIKPPDADHPKTWYWRDPEFKAWYELVQAETRKICK